MGQDVNDDRDKEAAQDTDTAALEGVVSASDHGWRDLVDTQHIHLLKVELDECRLKLAVARAQINTVRAEASRERSRLNSQWARKLRQAKFDTADQILAHILNHTPKNHGGSARSAYLACHQIANRVRVRYSSKGDPA